MFARVLLALCLMAPISSLLAEKEFADDVSFLPLVVLEASVESVDVVNRAVLLDGVWYGWPEDEVKKKYPQQGLSRSSETDQWVSFVQLRAGMRVLAVVDLANQMPETAESRVSLPVIVEISRGQ